MFENNLTWRFYCTLLMVAIGSGFTFGFNLGVTNNLEDFIKHQIKNTTTESTDFQINNKFATITSILCIGAICGAPIGTIFADFYGRKRALMINQ